VQGGDGLVSNATLGTLAKPYLVSNATLGTLARPNLLTGEDHGS